MIENKVINLSPDYQRDVVVRPLPPRRSTSHLFLLLTLALPIHCLLPSPCPSSLSLISASTFPPSHAPFRTLLANSRTALPHPQWTADHVTGLIQSLFRNMHVPELLFNIYEPRDRDDPWYRRIPAAIQIQPEGRTSLPDGWALKAEDDDEREDGDVMQVWNCADGKQRMSAIRKCVGSLLSRPTCRTARAALTTLGTSSRRFMTGQVAIVRPNSSCIDAS